MAEPFAAALSLGDDWRDPWPTRSRPGSRDLRPAGSASSIPPRPSLPTRARCSPCCGAGPRRGLGIRGGIRSDRGRRRALRRVRGAASLTPRPPRGRLPSLRMGGSRAIAPRSRRRNPTGSRHGDSARHPRADPRRPDAPRSGGQSLAASTDGFLVGGLTAAAGETSHQAGGATGTLSGVALSPAAVENRDRLEPGAPRSAGPTRSRGWAGQHPRRAGRTPCARRLHRRHRRRARLGPSTGRGAHLRRPSRRRLGHRRLHGAQLGRNRPGERSHRDRRGGARGRQGAVLPARGRPRSATYAKDPAEDLKRRAATGHSRRGRLLRRAGPEPVRVPGERDGDHPRRPRHLSDGRVLRHRRANRDRIYAYTGVLSPFS